MSPNNPVLQPEPLLLAPQPGAQDPPSLDLRIWERFDAPPGTVCRMTTVTGWETASASVTNVSRGGLQFVTERTLDRGTCLMAELRSRSGLFVRILLVVVVYALLRDDGQFTLGVEFLEPITTDELRLFLA